MTDRETDHDTRSVTVGRIHVRGRLRAMRPKNAQCAEICHAFVHCINTNRDADKTHTVNSLGSLYQKPNP